MFRQIFSGLALLAALAVARPASADCSASCAEASARCASACTKCAQRCGESRIGQKCRPCKPCSVIEPTRCITLPGAPCPCLKHKCATPLYPCGGYCIPETCHKPPVTCYPCGEVCLPTACHKPATPVSVEFCCECQPALTGSRELIASSCGCAACASPGAGASGGKCGECSANGWSD